ncbi:hypothetical protein K435DRAFT_854886 [Dendrothele bispora CBS 962.96]|uniref:Uncharacterized protein n=1 Tax=Dendrothele bispora (strain CBS 962.96) TaxID=1314807 RepID=A0A4S8ME03_DENBC|nr:hypothetical protein K435DRAFT_854886 [Dendrothele bispora CBS 962.96]
MGSITRLEDITHSQEAEGHSMGLGLLQKNDRTYLVTHHRGFIFWTVSPVLQVLIHSQFRQFIASLADQNLSEILNNQALIKRVDSIHNAIQRDVEHLTEMLWHTPKLLSDIFIVLIEVFGSGVDNNTLCWQALRLLQMFICRAEQINLLLIDADEFSQDDQSTLSTAENHQRWYPMTIYLQKVTLRHASGVFSKMIQELLFLVRDSFVDMDFFRDTNSFVPMTNFFRDTDTVFFRRTIVVHFIHWFSRCSNTDLYFRKLLIEAKILDLIDSAIAATAGGFELGQGSLPDES